MIYTKFKIEEIKKELESCLTEERYIHSIGVMEMAEILAKRFSCDVQKAKFAGLLHDCAKCLSKEESLKYTDCLLECELPSLKTWHAPIGRFIAKNKYGIDDEEILNAIRWHTVGRINMSDFEKIIYLADKIELRTREKQFREKIETALDNRNNLDDAMLMSFKLTIKSLIERNLPICSHTIDIYNDLLKKFEV